MEPYVNFKHGGHPFLVCILRYILFLKCFVQDCNNCILYIVYRLIHEVFSLRFSFGYTSNFIPMNSSKGP